MPVLSLESRRLSHDDVLSLLRKAIGDHFDVQLGDEPVEIGNQVFQEPVVRIYDKETTEVRLSLWLCR